MNLSSKLQDSLVTFVNAFRVCAEGIKGNSFKLLMGEITTLYEQSASLVVAIDAETVEVPNHIHFDGKTYDPARDKQRLKNQLGRVFQLLCTGEWWTLSELAASSDGTEAGVSARLRDLRKPRFGAWIIDTERSTVSDGLWVYRMRNPDGTKLPPVKPKGGGFIVAELSGER